MKKRLVALLCAFLMVCTFMAVGLAEESESGSKFDSVLLQKGTLLLKEYKEIGEITLYLYSIDYGTINFENAKLTDIESGNEYSALRIEANYIYNTSKVGTWTGVLDADEIASVITTLQYINDHISELKDYSEIIYTANSGVQLGAYCNSDGKEVFISSGSGETTYLKVSDLDALINMFKKAQKAIPVE